MWPFVCVCGISSARKSRRTLARKALSTPHAVITVCKRQCRHCHANMFRLDIWQKKNPQFAHLWSACTHDGSNTQAGKRAEMRPRRAYRPQGTRCNLGNQVISAPTELRDTPISCVSNMARMPSLSLSLRGLSHAVSSELHRFSGDLL